MTIRIKLICLADMNILNNECCYPFAGQDKVIQPQYVCIILKQNVTLTAVNCPSHTRILIELFTGKFFKK